MPLSDAPSLLTLMWSPLTVVTAQHEGQRGGQIAVGAFAASIVPAQPRVLVQIQKRNHTNSLIQASGKLAVHVIAREQWHWVKHWGFRSQTEVDKFEGVDWFEHQDGLPVLEGVLGWMTCRVVNHMDGGDMAIWLADVTDATRNTRAQAIRWHEVQQVLPPDWAEEYARKLNHDVPDSGRRMSELSAEPPWSVSSEP
ncbi:MAG: flavin reductase family protein [Chloroflexi bacterium]|nr:flavin reductase family protein [Chloroflexota bacterium]MYD17461.1 flavin reductase family protein [Chloroflexota bacterium]MYJ02095.1 flavin reductase family protein [Chloroflexota bacterium]